MSGLSISRRGLLTGLSVLGTSAALGACGAKTGSDTSSASRAPASAWIIPFWRVDLGGGPGKQVNTAPVD
ncbi:hypothetical protein ABZ753_30690, partial [Streptomyces griseoincarnatus]